jgi:hypothetical protein
LIGAVTHVNRGETCRRQSKETSVTLLWFVIWFLSNTFDAHQPLIFNPVNGWAGTLLLAIALDLSAAHAGQARRGKRS